LNIIITSNNTQVGYFAKFIVFFAYIYLCIPSALEAKLSWAHFRDIPTSPKCTKCNAEKITDWSKIRL